MRIPRGDWMATALVALATVAGVLWAVDAAPPGLDALRATACFVLACGFVASAGAVVPGFEGLLHGSRWYLAIASLLGFGALATGVLALVTEEGWWLAGLIVTTIVLWAMSTVRHVRAAAPAHARPTTRLGGRPHRPAAV